MIWQNGPLQQSQIPWYVMSDTPLADQEKLLAILQDLPPFSQCPSPVLEGVVASSGLIRLVNGDLLFQRGTPCGTFFLLVEGRIKLLLPTNSKHAGRVVAVERAGHGLNTPALFTDPNRHLWSAQSQGNSLVIGIPRAALVTLMEAMPTVRLRLLGEISSQLVHIIRFKTGFLAKCAARRVMEYLLELVPVATTRDDAIVVLPSQKQEIAAKLLLEPATLSRTLHQLQDRELILVRHRQVKIPSLRNFRTQMNEWEQRIIRCSQGDES